ncbi:hypothetical protein MED92_00040 [Oceanospirillum sp. MED92]|uniref:Solute-binding protein family 3/N-terminal domain-containing protein n=2 Tax=Neptuniibacter caesariensis TaxID=207954 RepID=A0A7U8C1Y6_NEPCE|nr:hypothetical protein MED92_00040 [Oceanospirillum sp. MED92] [Neptuniibacter caesariensis]
MFLRILTALFIVWAYLLPVSGQAKEIITLYTYHDTPPFITGDKTGLTYDLADYLSRHSSNVSIEVMSIPRKRLNQLIDSTAENILVPWVSPYWFKKQNLSRFIWSEELMFDASVYIWSSKASTDFNKPQDLIGYRLGGVRGYRYVGVDPLVSDNLIIRSNANNEKQLLRMLLQNRVDVGIIPYSSAQYLLWDNQWSTRFTLTNHHQFTRYLMVRSGNNSLNTQLLETVEKMKSDPIWRQVLTNYGLATDPKALLIE